MTTDAELKRIEKEFKKMRNQGTAGKGGVYSHGVTGSEKKTPRAKAAAKKRSKKK